MKTVIWEIYGFHDVVANHLQAETVAGQQGIVSGTDQPDWGVGQQEKGRSNPFTMIF